MYGRSKIKQDIAEYGWHGVHAFPDNEIQDRFTYTIGLSESYQGPEVAIFGIDRKRAHQLLAVCANLLRSGATLDVDVPDGRLIRGGYKVVFRIISKEAYPEYLGTAVAYFGNTDFRAVVMFLPDSLGRFPWEPGYNYVRVNEGLAIVETPGAR